jgi:hypothetical protein
MYFDATLSFFNTKKFAKNLTFYDYDYKLVGSII